MGKHICPSAAMPDTNKYSSPVPFVGLYIAGATLVCLILIVSDVWNGFRRRKLWFPCRFFSLNSVTLTLISIGSKIPVDLTTDMPSAVDQLSKLCGTTFVCVTMGFMIPSIGNKSELDSYANITALTIFVVTVIVNVCIQMATGVIYSFVVEHSIILFCMILLLIRYWIGGFEINSFMVNSSYTDKDYIREGAQSMMDRVKVCFENSYTRNLQFILACAGFTSGHVSLVCTTCFLLLSEALLRSLFSKFCGGASDYGWSMWLLLTAQFLTVTVTTLALNIRWISRIEHEWREDICPIFGRRQNQTYTFVSTQVQLLYLLSQSRNLKPFAFCIKTGVLAPFIFIDDIIQFLGRLVLDKIVDCIDILDKCRGIDTSIDRHFLSPEKSEEDMNRTLEVAKRNPPNHLIHLLREIPPSGETPERDTVSSLSLVLMVEIAKLFPDTSLYASLKEILDEAFDVLYFIDKNVGSLENRLKWLYTQIIWHYGLTKALVRDDVLQEVKRKMACPGVLELYAQSDIAGVFSGLFYDEFLMNEEARHIAELMFLPPVETREELYCRIKQVFVGILHLLLPQLPGAIFNHILESTAHDYEDRVRFCLKVVCKFEWLESTMPLCFPPGSSITSLAATQVVDTDTSRIGNSNALSSAPAADFQGIEQYGSFQV